MKVIHLIEMSLYAAAGMLWEILWALVLGFALSGVVIAFLPRKQIASALGRPGIKEILRALIFGAISSSCSFAAASTSRSLFQKGAHIIPALAFMLASTNLVIELSAIIWILMGWQFVVAEFAGGIILVFIMAALMRLLAPLNAFDEKRLELEHATRNDDAMQVASPRTLAGWQEVARAFVMEGAMIWKDILVGVVVSGFLMVCVPNSVWQSLFLQRGAELSGRLAPLQIVENALVGPIVSMLSFVCSVGNIPLAAVLYRGGITFGGAVSFIFADLIIIPLILVYRRYYGWRIALWITGIFYVSMVLTGILVDLIFSMTGLTPDRGRLGAVEHMHLFEMNYTFWLNLVFIILAAVLVVLSKMGTGKGAHCCDE